MTLSPLDAPRPPGSPAPWPETVSGRQLYRLLPRLYRRSDNGDLAAFLDAFGALLDPVRNTLDQLLADGYADRPPEGRAAQGWMLPYLAQLLDARLLSPHADGRRREVSEAVAWRQRKGTATSAESIAEAVGQLEVEVQEGWKRLVRTPRPGDPVLPASAFGAEADGSVPGVSFPGEAPVEGSWPDPQPSLRAAHPGLAGGAVDLRRNARALRTTPDHPQARLSRFAGGEALWRQAHRRGAPCTPGAFDDPSPRSVDLRSPAPTGAHAAGHAHPRRVLLFLPPPQGFFPVDAERFSWAARFDPAHEDHVADETVDGWRRIFHPGKEEARATPGVEADPPEVVITTQPLPFSPARGIEVRDLSFQGTLTVQLPQNLSADSLPDPVAPQVVLERVAARRLVVIAPPLAPGQIPSGPLVVARDCLFERVRVVSSGGGVLNATVELEHCTVLERLRVPRLNASDCLLPDLVQLDLLAVADPPPEEIGDGPQAARGGCVRYSRVPPALRALDSAQLRLSFVTSSEAVFQRYPSCDGGALVPAAWGRPGWGTLHPATPESILAGAEDGGELGADHHRRSTLARRAVLDKLTDFLPLGTEAVLVPDPRLLSPPPEAVPEEPPGP
ncbi:MAG: phage tail protein [Acidobacteriota bacterium]